MNIKIFNIALCVSVLVVSPISFAKSTISWANWTKTTPSKVFGSINTGSEIVKITFKGKYSFAQTDNGSSNYWNPSEIYTSTTVTNAPSSSDIIALNEGGTAIVTFSKPVQNPILALVSWNVDSVDFGVPIEILSYGNGYFGSGTPVINATNTGFHGDGDVHGVIRLIGTYSSITFTHITENWHGFTIGLANTSALLNGSVKGLDSHTVSCVNNETGQSVNIPVTSNSNFDCKKAGLKITSPQNVTITINGNLE